MIRTGRRVLAACLAIVVAACGSDDSVRSAPVTEATVTSSASTLDGPVLTAADAMEVFVEFPRYLQAQRRVEVAVQNLSSADMHITSVGLSSPYFTSTPARAVDSVIRPGRRRDLKVDLGEVQCETADTTADDITVALLRTRNSSGAESDIEVRIDPGSLRSIFDDECGRQQVFDTVDIDYADRWTDNGDSVSASVELTHRSGEPVTVSQVGGSVIFVVEAVEPVDGTADGVDVTVSDDRPSATIDVRIRAERCEPHAVAESKKTFLFPLWATVGAGDLTFVTVEPTGDLRAVLQLLIERCQVTERGT